MISVIQLQSILGTALSRHSAVGHSGLFSSSHYCNALVRVCLCSRARISLVFIPRNSCHKLCRSSTVLTCCKIALKMCVLIKLSKAIHSSPVFHILTDGFGHLTSSAGVKRTLICGVICILVTSEGQHLFVLLAFCEWRVLRPWSVLLGFFLICESFYLETLGFEPCSCPGTGATLPAILLLCL